MRVSQGEILKLRKHHLPSCEPLGAELQWQPLSQLDCRHILRRHVSGSHTEGQQHHLHRVRQVQDQQLDGAVGTLVREAPALLHRHHASRVRLYQ